MPTPAIQHVGLHRQRLAYPCEQTTRERAFAEAWERANDEHHRYLYELSLVGEHDPSTIFGDKRTPAFPLTQDTATAAATVVQWLGSNVGFSFLEEALRVAGYRIAKDLP